MCTYLVPLATWRRRSVIICISKMKTPFDIPEPISCDGFLHQLISKIFRLAPVELKVLDTVVTTQQQNTNENGEIFYINVWIFASFGNSILIGLVSDDLEELIIQEQAKQLPRTHLPVLRIVWVWK